MPNEYLHVHTLKDFNTARIHIHVVRNISPGYGHSNLPIYHRKFTIALTQIDRHDTFVI